MGLILSSEYFIFTPESKHFIELRKIEYFWGEVNSALANKFTFIPISLSFRHPQLLEEMLSLGTILKMNSY